MSNANLSCLLVPTGAFREVGLLDEAGRPAASVATAAVGAARA